MSDVPATTAPPPPSRASLMPLKDAKTIGQALATQQFQRAVADAAPAQMTAQRLLATFRQAARNNPAFDQCNLMSVLGVFMTCSYLGLEPNTPLGHAYMIPFAKKRFDRATRKLVDDGYDLQLIIGYQGFLDLAYRNPRVSSIAAHMVYEGDDFSFEYGSNQHLQHRPKGMQAEHQPPRYSYMYAKLTGGEAFEVVPYHRIISIRNGSQGYRAALAAKERAEKEGWKVPAAYTEAPWVKHFDAMAMKTAVRHGYKWLPKTVEMQAAARIEEQQDRGLIDFGPVLEGQVNPLDEDLPLISTGGVDPGAAFGERDPDPAPEPPPLAAQPPAAPTPARTAAASPAPAQPPAQRLQAAALAASPEPAPDPAPMPFGAYLADEHGEVVEAVGNAGFFDDPLAYARAFVALREGTKNRDVLAEHNADALDDAQRASEPARALLAALLADAATGDATATPVPVLVLTNGDGKPDLRGYLATLRDHASAQTAATIDAWCATQRPIIAGLAAVTRRNAEKIVADARTALGVDKPPEQPTPPPQAEEPPPPTEHEPPPGFDMDEAVAVASAPLWSSEAQSVIDMILACKTGDDITTLAQNAAVRARMTRVQESNPDEFKRLRDFATEQRARLTAGR